MITLGSDFLKIPHLSEKIELLKKMKLFYHHLSR